MTVDLSALGNSELLALHCQVMGLLRERNVVRSSNNPVADYTESLVAKALGATLVTASQSGYDAVGADGTRYQIKGRRLTAKNRRTQLSAIRNLATKPFDVLAAVVFNEELQVRYGALIPHAVVAEVARYTAHTNSHIFLFTPAVLARPDVTDITELLRATARTM